MTETSAAPPPERPATQAAERAAGESARGDNEGRAVMVVGPDGTPLGAVNLDRDGTSDEPAVSDMIEQPAKVMRIGSMIKQLLEEVRAAPLDDASRVRLREIHQTSIRELGEGLAPDLRDELNRLSLPLAEDQVPSDPELRIAQAQLVGWLEGLFHGIQTALFAQQMAARMQLEEMRRRALPGGPSGPDGTGVEVPAFGRPGSSGPYL